METAESYPQVILKNTTTATKVKEMEQLVGRWKLEKTLDTLDDFFQTVGVKVLCTKGDLLVTTYEKITKDGDSWEILLKSTYRNYGIKFRIDEEFDEHTVGDRKYKSIVKIEDGKLVHYQKSTKPSLPDAKITRYLEDDDTMVAVFELIDNDKLKARRIHKRDKELC